MTLDFPSILFSPLCITGKEVLPAEDLVPWPTATTASCWPRSEPRHWSQLWRFCAKNAWSGIWRSVFLAWNVSTILICFFDNTLFLLRSSQWLHVQVEAANLKSKWCVEKCKNVVIYISDWWKLQVNLRSRSSGLANWHSEFVLLEEYVHFQSTQTQHDFSGPCCIRRSCKLQRARQSFTSWVGSYICCLTLVSTSRITFATELHKPDGNRNGRSWIDSHSKLKLCLLQTSQTMNTVRIPINTTCHGTSWN